MQEIKLIQDTPEWHKFRASRIGSSDAPVIMGSSPWKTVDELFLEKIGKGKKQKETAAMSRGKKLEPIARARHELMTGLEFEPCVLVDKEHDFIMGSFDGRCIEKNIDLEIKCPGAKDHALALQGKIPEKYVWQCLHLLMVSGSELLHYVSFDGKRTAWIGFYPDPEKIQRLREAELKFWQRVTSYDKL